MRSKYQLLAVAAISAAIVLGIGVLALGGLLFVFGPVQSNVSVAEAKSSGSDAAASAVQTEPAAGRTITVVGEGKVSAQPDTAQANIGVEIVNSDIKQATSEATDTMQAVLNALKEQGVAEKDIQTSYYNVWVERPYTGPDSPQPVAPLYHVNNNVSVTIRDLNKVTNILGAAIEAGANTINGVTFSLADPAKLRSEARQKAVDDALVTARELAALNGVEVGEVVSVSEVISNGAYFVSEQAAAAQGLGGGGGPISPGEVEIQSQLQVTYAIK
jgi:uncharacterized protein YggE